MSQVKRSETRTLFDDVRYGFAFVAEQAQHVNIRHDRLLDYSAILPDKSLDNTLDAEHHFSSPSIEETASYIIMLDAINFGSGYAPLMAAEGWEMIDHSTYFTLSTRLKHYFEQHGVVTAEQMVAFDIQEMKNILALPSGRYSDEFAGLVRDSVIELGQAVIKQFDGSFEALVNAAQGSAAWLVEWLAALSGFHDVHDYHGRPVAFYKRAQITAADLHLAFAQKGTVLFKDIGVLTMFADNGVPHVLRCDGILEYKDDLATRIDAGEELQSGSDEEIEIRACAAHAVELIARDKEMTAMAIDHILWHRSVERSQYVNTRSHRTLSRFY